MDDCLYIHNTDNTTLREHLANTIMAGLLKLSRSRMCLPAPVESPVQLSNDVKDLFDFQDVAKVLATITNEDTKIAFVSKLFFSFLHHC